MIIIKMHRSSRLDRRYAQREPNHNNRSGYHHPSSPLANLAWKVIGRERLTNIKLHKPMPHEPSMRERPQESRHERSRRQE